MTKDPITNSIIEKIVKRAAAGFEEYGTTLADNKGDLDYWLTHLQEELLDAAQYIEKIKWLIKEGKDIHLKGGQ
jgi:hypothetical protein